MHMTPHEILAHMGINIPPEGVSFSPSDTFIVTECLRLTGKAIASIDYEADDIKALSTALKVSRGKFDDDHTDYRIEVMRNTLRRILHQTFGVELMFDPSKKANMQTMTINVLRFFVIRLASQTAEALAGSSTHARAPLNGSPSIRSNELVELATKLSDRVEHIAQDALEEINSMPHFMLLAKTVDMIESILSTHKENMRGALPYALPTEKEIADIRHALKEQSPLF